jgi:hypothetical protein
VPSTWADTPASKSYEERGRPVSLHRHDRARVGRAIAVLGLAAGAAWLGWRVLVSLREVPAWLAAPGLVVEIVGALAAALLIWSLWRPSGSPRPPTTYSGRVQVLVRVEDHSREAVRSTILAALQLEPERDVTVVDLRRRPEVERIAAEQGVGYLPVDADDGSGLVAASLMVPADAYFVVEAGDIPVVDSVSLLAAYLDAPEIAAVQGSSVTTVSDSAEHGPDGRHEHRFERQALNCGLSERGSGVITGSGVLVRRVALEAVGPVGGSHVVAELALTVRLLARGWRVVAPNVAVVASVTPLNSPDVANADRRRRAAACMTLLTGQRDTMWVRGLTPSQRIGLATWCIRPLSGLRRLVFVAVVVGALLSGQAPFRPEIVPVVALGLPYIALTALATVLLSGGTLALGDRTRWSLRTMGPDAAALLGAPPVASATAARPARGGTRAVRQGGTLFATVIVVNLAVVARSVSDRWLGILPEMSRGLLACLLAIALWVVALSLDELRLLARRTQLRRVQRHPTELRGWLGDRPVVVNDLSMLGAGLWSAHGASPGAELELFVEVPPEVLAAPLHATVAVRNVDPQPDGSTRLGVEFLDLSTDATNALTSWCVVDPARRVLGDAAGTTDAPAPVAPIGPSAPGRQLVVRISTLLAVVGVISLLLPGAAWAADARHESAAAAPSPAFGDAVAQPPLGSTDLPVDGLVGATVAGLALMLAAGVMFPGGRQRRSAPPA